MDNDDSPNTKPHALCFPFPSQSHIKAMLKLSKLLHDRGFHITFVNTEFNQSRLLRTTSLDPQSLEPLGFRFETISDGLAGDSDPNATQDVVTLCYSTRTNFTGQLLDLVARINDRSRAVVFGSSCRPVSCVVVDGFASLAVGSEVQERLGIPVVKFFPVSASAVVGLQQLRHLLDKGIVPIKESNVPNDYLDDMIVDWIPEMKDLRMRDLISFWRITEINDIMFNYCMDIGETAHEASAVIIQTFDALEKQALEYIKQKIPNLYTIGPLQLLLDTRVPQDPLKTIPYNLWKEDTECLKWLDAQKPDSVIYVNFGSVIVLTPQQVVDMGWGLANSNHPFLWVIRDDLVFGDTSCLSKEFLDEISGRSLIISWCSQEDVLNHPSIGGFLTHCGWNSVIESVSSGVPLLCFPFFADQQTSSWVACNEVGVGLEIDKDVKREQVEEVVRDLMENKKGRQMKSNAIKLKKLAQEATKDSNGSSFENLDKLLNEVLLQN